MEYFRLKSDNGPLPTDLNYDLQIAFLLGVLNTVKLTYDFHQDKNV